MTGCASEDAEVDELGEEEDSEPPELYSGDVSRAGRLRRLTALDTSPEYSSGGSSSSSSPSSSTSLSSSAHPVTRDECPGSHPVGPSRAQSGNPDLTGWDDWLLGIGDGRDGDTIAVPEEICIKIGKTKKEEEKALAELVEKVFPEVMRAEKKRQEEKKAARREEAARRKEAAGREETAGRQVREQEEPSREAGPEQEFWVKGRCILTPTNANVDEVNHFLVSKWQGKEQELLSADSADEEQDRRSYSSEFLASLNPTGLPAHRLVVKSGIPLMLLRNLEPGAGLCNGTRLIFKGMQGYVMVCTIMDTNVKVLIPRISLKPKDREYPFEWSRRQ